jgi:hypothetical protein
MGGLGSGRPASFGYNVDLCEKFHDIDLASFNRNGYLFTGCVGKVTWRREGQIIASIDYRVEYEGLRLSYRIRPRGGEWRSVVELIPFARTPAQFGGCRTWFACPGCQRRCRILYGDANFRCRKCHGLRYESQYQDHLSRIQSKRHKLRSRIDSVGSLEDPFPPKTKNMHWSTYSGLAASEILLAQQWQKGVVKWLKRTQPR